jgi:hypothetical protein
VGSLGFIALFMFGGGSMVTIDTGVQGKPGIAVEENISLRGRGRRASLRHVFARQDSPQGRQGSSGMVGCGEPARS